jgi:hypothetical protein
MMFFFLDELSPLYSIAVEPKGRKQPGRFRTWVPMFKSRDVRFSDERKNLGLPVVLRCPLRMRHASKLFPQTHLDAIKGFDIGHAALPIKGLEGEEDGGWGRTVPALELDLREYRTHRCIDAKCETKK